MKSATRINNDERWEQNGGKLIKIKIKIVRRDYLQLIRSFELEHSLIVIFLFVHK